MSTIHLPSFNPERLAEIIEDISVRLGLGLSIQAVPGSTGRGLVEISTDDSARRTKTRFRNNRPEINHPGK